MDWQQLLTNGVIGGAQGGVANDEAKDPFAILGSALTGGLPGAALGLGLAGIQELIGKENEPIIDHRTQELDSMASQLKNTVSTTGINQANATERAARQSAREQLGSINNNPAVASNPALQAALFNKVQGNVENVVSDARVRGAGLDQSIERQAQSDAANIIGSNRGFDYAKQLEEYRRKKQRGFFENMAANVLTDTFGRINYKINSPTGKQGGENFNTTSIAPQATPSAAPSTTAVDTTEPSSNDVLGNIYNLPGGYVPADPLSSAVSIW